MIDMQFTRKTVPGLASSSSWAASCATKSHFSTIAKKNEYKILVWFWDLGLDYREELTRLNGCNMELVVRSKTKDNKQKKGTALPRFEETFATRGY